MISTAWATGITVAALTVSVLGMRDRTPAGAERPRTAAESAPETRTAPDLTSAVARLRRPARESRSPRPEARNPFALAVGRGNHRAAPAAAARPPSPRPAADAAVTACVLTLAGTAESLTERGPVRTAIVVNGRGEMVFVTVGATVDDHFTVQDIGEGEVTLADVRHTGTVRIVYGS